MIRRLALGLAAVGTLALVALLWARAGAAWPWQRHVLPGSLSASHAWLEADCTSCHTPAKGPDAAKCIGCHACTIACKAEHEIPVGVNRCWVKTVEKGTFPDTQRLFFPVLCNQCVEAPCVNICPTSALYKRRDGIVDLNGAACIGCRACMVACPYDQLFIDPNTRTICSICCDVPPCSGSTHDVRAVNASSRFARGCAGSTTTA